VCVLYICIYIVDVYVDSSKEYNESDIDTLILLQQFKHCIMSNSTFIWWAVWLGNFTNVIAPSKWFGPTGPKQWEDIYEPSWIRI
jgi:hypothetical protein